MTNKEALLAQREEEIKQLKGVMEETEKKTKVACQEEIKTFKEKCETEKETAKKGIKEFAEGSKKEEKLLASAIYEMGCILNKIMQEKKKPGASALLGKLAEEHHKGASESFIATQINARAQSNTKKV